MWVLVVLSLLNEKGQGVQGVRLCRGTKNDCIFMRLLQCKKGMSR